MIKLICCTRRSTSRDIHIARSTCIGYRKDDTNIALLVIEGLPNLHGLHSPVLFLLFVLSLQRIEVWVILSVKNRAVFGFHFFNGHLSWMFVLVPLFNIWSPDFSLIVVDTATAIHSLNNNGF